MRTAESASDTAHLPGDTVPHIIAVVFLLTFGAILECWKLSSLTDPEIWGHLRAGTWMLENRTWPQSALFSQVTNTPWRDLNWGFDLLTAGAYRLLGLRAIPALLIVLRIGLAGVTFLLAGGWRNFCPASVLSAAAQYILLPTGPTAMHVSLLFFGVELLLLMQSRESGDLRSLRPLPILFVVWANLDTGFVYGITLFLLFVKVVFLEHWSDARGLRWLDQPKRQIPLKPVSLTLCVSLIVSLANPYSWHPYVSFFQNEFSPVNHHLPGYNAMSFRQPQDYLLMLLGMSAFLALGLRRSRNLFQIAVLVGTATLAFCARRENGLLALASVAIIGHAILQSRAGETGVATWTWRSLIPFAVALVVAFAVFAVRIPKDHAALLTRVARTLPVRAADFFRQNPQPPPLFNTYLWGGFLSWYLPEYPVAIDARRGLYPDGAELDYFKAMNAEIPYRSFPPMNNGRTFLLEKGGTMGEAFRAVAGFRVIYEDDISIVYAHEGRE